MSRAAREQAILALIDREAIGTQDALVHALAAHGIVASQGTVSRDIQRLRLGEVPVPAGGHRYAPPGAAPSGPSPAADAAPDAWVAAPEKRRWWTPRSRQLCTLTARVLDAASGAEAYRVRASAMGRAPDCGAAEAGLNAAVAGRLAPSS